MQSYSVVFEIDPRRARTRSLKTTKNSPADASTGVIFISPARVILISPKGVSPACPKGSNARAFSNEQPLWPFKHTLAELHELEDKAPWVFETQYMQNPRPLTGLMYEREFKTYEVLPVTKQHKVKAYVDTADTGKDYLCCIVYVETEKGNFILDVYYTQAAMETTEPETARILTKWGVEEAIIESNNGGRGFARNVETNLRLMGNNKTVIRWFHQSENKDIRIFNHSNEVQNLTHFPKDWAHLFPKFYQAITKYKKQGTNTHDDAPDALTGTVEKRPDGKADIKRLKRIFK